MRIFVFAYTLFTLLLLFTATVHAVVDPRSTPNNKIGINSLSPEAEIADIKDVVNTHGDWGYALIVIKKNERDLERWQKIFYSLSDNHIIPIVRIATEVDESGNWQRPTAEDAENWAEFLNKLYWPTKNRYVQVYNEVNRASEWGGSVDPTSYATELHNTINKLKSKSDNFFVLNAPLDLALETSANTLDAELYFAVMHQTQPGLFEKLDGWASHSYPNPAFSASPTQTGKTSISGYVWELEKINEYTKKDFPVFITETGWTTDNLTEDEIAAYYKHAFELVWNSEKVVAVTPFLLSYIDPLFSHFSFIDHSEEKRPRNFYTEVKNLKKVRGEPRREEQYEIKNLHAPKKIIVGSPARIQLTIKNTGNYVWNTADLSLQANGSNIESQTIYEPQKIYPGQIFEAEIKIKSSTEGTTQYLLALTNKGNKIYSQEFEAQSLSYINFVLDLLRSAVQ